MSEFIEYRGREILKTGKGYACAHAGPYPTLEQMERIIDFWIRQEEQEAECESREARRKDFYDGVD